MRLCHFPECLCVQTSSFLGPRTCKEQCGSSVTCRMMLASPMPPAKTLFLNKVALRGSGWTLIWGTVGHPGVTTPGTAQTPSLTRGVGVLWGRSREEGLEAAFGSLDLSVFTLGSRGAGLGRGPWGAGSVSHARHVSSSSGRGAMSLRVAPLCGCRPPALPAPLTAPVNAAAGRGLLLPTVVAADASRPPCRLTRVGHGGLTSHPSASPRPLVASA